MKVHRCLISLAVLAPCAVAAAQTGTAEGVQALIRGDYATAVRILRPLAEDAPEPDPLAQFFMAALYETGRGVAMNPIRACGLYSRAASSTNPLMAQAAALARGHLGRAPVMRDLCSAASAGVWREPPAAAFTLAADHWVRIDQTGFTVGYKGTQKTAPMEWGGVGWQFLPSRHTQLDVSRPIGTRRHFIEFFTWIPNPISDQWALVWFAREVVGVDVLPVPGDGLITTVAGPEPPTSFRIDDVARILVNADGEVERVASGEASRRIHVPYTGLR